MTTTEQQEPAVFHSDAAFEIRLPAMGGVRKQATLRMPTVAEWAARSRAIKTIQHRLGPGQTTTETTGAEQADASLLKRLMTDEDGEYLDKRGPAGNRDIFDEAEASELIRRLVKAEIGADPEHDSDALIVSVSVLGNVETKHFLRMPTVRELRDHRRASFSFVDLRRGKQQLKMSVDEFCRFYDQLAVKAEGYEGPVPAPHKMAAVSEMLAVIDELDSEEDPNG